MSMPGSAVVAVQPHEPLGPGSVPPSTVQVALSQVQVCEVVSQWPVEQSSGLRHSTQRCTTGSHNPVEHWSLLRHSTQTPRAVSQRAGPPSWPQSWLLVHAGAQEWVALSHKPVAHWVLLTHSTQAPASTSHTGLGPAQLAFDVHVTTQVAGLAHTPSVQTASAPVFVNPVLHVSGQLEPLGVVAPQEYTPLSGAPGEPVHAFASQVGAPDHAPKAQTGSLPFLV